MDTENVKQGSPEWHAARLGMVTGSRFADVMTKGRGGGASKTAQTYMMELIGERLTGMTSDEIKSKYLDWGNEHEPLARVTYTWQTGLAVAQTGFVRHPELEWVGASPDGLVGDEGIVEIKCPYTPKAHLSTILSGEVPSEYVWQVQGNLWVTGRKWCDFISFHPRMPEDLQLYVLRVPRDEDMIEDLDRKVRRFCEQIEIKLSKIQAAAAKFHTTEGPWRPINPNM